MKKVLLAAAMEIRPILTQTIFRSFDVMIIAVVLLPFLMCTTRPRQTTEAPHIKYSVSNMSVTIVMAVTPYDQEKKTRNVFINWFRRGFETVLTGKPPLMIEWDTTAEGLAGQKGYTSGLDEGERFIKNPKYLTVLTAVNLE